MMDILERQSEICMHDKNSNQLAVTNIKQSNDRNNKLAKKEVIDAGIRDCADKFAIDTPDRIL